MGCFQQLRLFLIGKVGGLVSGCVFPEVGFQQLRLFLIGKVFGSLLEALFTDEGFQQLRLFLIGKDLPSGYTGIRCPYQMLKPSFQQLRLFLIGKDPGENTLTFNWINKFPTTPIIPNRDG